MGTLEMIGAILMIVASVVVIAVVSILDSKGDGISALAGGNSFLSNNGDRSINATLNKVVKVFAVIFFVVTVVVYAVAK